MCRIGYCPGCGQEGLILTKHHKWKRSVWGRNKKKNGKVIWMCRDCHTEVEAEITRKENELLQQHPEIYIDTLSELLRRVIGHDSNEASCGATAAKGQKPERVKHQEGSRASFPQGLLMLVD